MNRRPDLMIDKQPNIIARNKTDLGLKVILVTRTKKKKSTNPNQRGLPTRLGRIRKTADSGPADLFLSRTFGGFSRFSRPPEATAGPSCPARSH